MLTSVNEKTMVQTQLHIRDNSSRAQGCSRPHTALLRLTFLFCIHRSNRGMHRAPISSKPVR